MQFPERFSDLPEYAFPRLRKLLAGAAPGGPEISMSIGEPRHAQPEAIARVIAERADDFSRYPPNDGTPELRAAIADWLSFRFGVALDPEREIVVLNGSREGLFNAALALSPESTPAGRPVVLVPNPF
jgi:aspartate/methionine/tyrosine aminotransferase